MAFDKYNLSFTNMICLDFFVLMSICVSMVLSQTCEVMLINPSLLNHLPSDTVQQSATIADDLHNCARFCSSTSQCMSFSYIRADSTCNVYYVDSSGSLGSTPTPGVYYSDKNVWDKGSCVNHDCGPEEACLPVPSGFICRRKLVKCFTQFQPAICLEEFRGVKLGTPTILGSNTQSSLITCISNCTIQYPSYKSIGFDTVGTCVCYQEAVLDYQMTVGSLTPDPTVSTYDKIV